MKVCEKALDRIEKLKKGEQEWNDCLRYKICPACGRAWYGEVMSGEVGLGKVW
jgi:hypothetical protein